VFKGIDLQRGRSVAIKRLDLRGLEDWKVEEVENEFKLLEFLKHPHIVTYIDAVKKDDFLHIILEFCENGALSSLLAKVSHTHPPCESVVCTHRTTRR
jgi:serine/threonine protein kinase